MSPSIEKGIKVLIAEAEKEIETIDVKTALTMLDNSDYQFVDIRDIRELQREGKIPGAHHAPRGMLEFWVDPDSPYHQEIFAQEKKYILYCAAAWRSALATQTLQNMGMRNVCHIGGGFSEWKSQNAPIEQLPERRP
ncbi:MAG: rhodanese-like domain-containing protein [Gammaproteobacteria bacterium]|nr:rhodanese-like domain-containing protein [Gammaproteobacteria bacterium]